LQNVSSGSTGPNAVYNYGSTSAFPTTSYEASNYWVDVAFNTTTTSPPPPPTTAYTIWPSTAMPGTVDTFQTLPVELGVKFTASEGGYITGIRFYKGAANTGTHVGNLWSSAGTLLARATFTGESAGGWQQVTFATPVAITANTVYVASYFSPTGDFSVDRNYFNTAVSNPPLQALQNVSSGSTGPNAVYNYGSSSAFPTTSYEASNYWVDVVFNGAVSSSGGLVGWWKFDDGSGTTAADSSGNGNTMTLFNGVSWVTGENGGYAISANGTNQYGAVPAINLSGTSTITVAFWANRTYSTTVESVMLENSTNYNGSTTGFGFFPDDTACGGIQAAVHGNVGYSVNCYRQPSSGVWHHLAIIYDKTQAGSNQTALYIDGVLQTPTSNLYTAQNTNSFGNNPIYWFSRDGTEFFNGGEIDDLRIYSQALTAAEIQQLYQTGSQ
jgi:Domain of unknown function (DUF4082)/Concanavalin A-like lectin/glucanases superfamily